MKKYSRLLALLVILSLFVMGQSGCTGCGGGGVTGDTTDPNVAITSPANNSTVSGTVTIQVTATDNVGVVKVEFYIDMNKVGEDTSPPYEYNWNTTSYTNGTHIIQATATDNAGNIGASAIVTVNINNAPRAVLIDDIHQNFHSFGEYSVTQVYATLISKLQSMGYMVRLASVVGFNPSISNYSIVLLPVPFLPYSDSEIQALVSFVNAGGKLIMQGNSYLTGDPTNTNLNNLSNALHAGITFNMDIVLDYTNNFGGSNQFPFYQWPLISDFVSHPTTAGVNTIVLFTSCSLSAQTPAIPIAYASSSAYTSASLSRGNIIVAAVAEIGRGKVIAIGDVHLFCDDVGNILGNSPINLYNNMTFFENIINW
jgi:hypothetical protein